MAALAAFTTLAVATPALANDDIAIIATERANGSMALGDTIAYSKSFDIALTNTVDEPVALEDLCLVAVTAEGDTFVLDTVDESLTTGMIEPGAALNGIAVFSSDSITVHTASAVRAGSDC
ncbi:hypothetical protein VE26_15360 [Devosia chinhatensis]|uniref:DUF4354 domain-containing protein n=1 Tax=Devosia chinhatensis TaxID=429727 RepID=A0A0F5FHI2_9HYPH|nr:hypothetical protein VE26_15360 [Devosia chinhatensis]